MPISRLGQVLRKTPNFFRSFDKPNGSVRNALMSSKGGLLPPEPYRTSFGLIRIVLVVVPGLLIGAAISKNIANFLEENDLFVPSDDDDDDD